MTSNSLHVKSMGMLSILSYSSAIAMASCPYPQIRIHYCTLPPSWSMPKDSSTALLLVTYMGCRCYTFTWACWTHSLCMYKCIWAIHIQSNPESGKLAFMYDLLVLAQPLHKFPRQQVLWTALTMVHFSLLQTGEFMVDQECFDPTGYLCIQNMTPSLSAQSEL